ncbi:MULTISPECIES: serine dehydratase subunit alpha family protein [unclassified Desulfovibrio]|uniref:L-cysteine desulfidase family protein n=1 Tax=unclassified Desulfovibrio TaxID=2593640 RepID=UPI000F5D6097|nr:MULTISPECIES: L-serine ammonia-lyase, iron-sulfur-dependent, subunit alpha [unclassified Desulfovibrio]RRD70702.1 serine dehydratase subunit alpha family protein [Desulfovibrio sp. OH1209_COT-279]RRD87104.1 serine dehydratase subunit alpha family protein [Desulfovibrio sp. OH1186_COT-070]
MYRDHLVLLLRRNVKPALGCTEPASIAVAVSRAHEESRGEVRGVHVRLSGNIFKNARGVGIPGTNEYGIEYAVALALACGDWRKGLEVFANVDEDSVTQAHTIMETVPIQMSICDSKEHFYIEAIVYGEMGHGRTVILENHTNIVLVERDGNVVEEATPSTVVNGKEKTADTPILKDMSIGDLRKEVEALPLEEIAFLIAGVPMNYRMARAGLERTPGLGLGAGLRRLMDEGVIEDNMVNKVRMYAAAAADARMAGLKLPVMSSAGSGNHGIIAILPPYIVCKEKALDEEKLIRALALSHLVTIAIKELSGPLSPVCGCAIAAGVGAAVAVAWLLGCEDNQLAGVINSMSGTLAGMLCDGAKGGCAFKLATAASEAVLCALLASQNIHVGYGQGIVSIHPETTLQNIGIISTQGMCGVDKTVLDVMLADALRAPL